MSCKKQTHVSVHIFGSSSVWLSCRPAAETWTCSDLTFTDWPSNDYDYDDEASCRRRSSLPVRYVWSGTSSELQHKHHPLPPSTELQLGAAPIQPTGRRANMHVCDYHRNSGKYLTFFFFTQKYTTLIFSIVSIQRCQHAASSSVCAGSSAQICDFNLWNIWLFRKNKYNLDLQAAMDQAQRVPPSSPTLPPPLSPLHLECEVISFLLVFLSHPWLVCIKRPGYGSKHWCLV